MRLLSISIAVFSLISVATTAAVAEDSLIVCGGSEIFIISATPGVVHDADRMWSWQASDSSGIQLEQAKTFLSTDECKPIGTTSLLITSSSGGVALIDRADKQCRFLSYAKNAHSACLLPGERIAVASSTGGDEILIFKIDPQQVQQPDPIARSPLLGAHGAVWDSGRERLWMLGERELQRIQLAADSRIVIEKTWQLPTEGGHDLTPTKDGEGFFVTTDTHVYRFDRATGEFTLALGMGELQKVKSVDEHPESGRIVFHQATAENWWSETIRFRDSSDTIHIPGKRLYKARWDVPMK